MLVGEMAMLVAVIRPHLSFHLSPWWESARAGWVGEM